MNDQVENSNVKSKKKAKMRTSDSELDVTDDSSELIKPKKKVKFRIEDEVNELQLKSKKRKVLASTDVDNTENMTLDDTKKTKKHETRNNQRDEQGVMEEDAHEHPDESHSNDTIDWPQSDLRTLVENIEQTIPEKDNLAFQTRADKLNWDDIAFGKYTGEDCKKTWFLVQKRIRRFRVLSELLQDAKQWISKPWTHFYKKTKHNRHPDMPKRPLSGYMLFYVKKKDKLLAQHPGLEMTEVTKRMAQMYKNISVEKREKYMQLALAEKKSYEEKLKEFYRRHPDIPRCPERSNHSKACETGLKKPATPFSCYFNDQLKNFHSESEGDRNSFKEQCKEQWKNMPDKKKVIWIDCALIEEDKYQEDLKNYIIQNPNYVSTFKSIVTKEERAIKERLAGKPIKPPNSAYSLFSQIMLKSEEIKKIDPKSRMKALADQWKMCSEEEKKVYQEHAEQLMTQYKLDFATYLDSLPESKRQEELQNNLPKRKGKKVDESKNKVEDDKNKNEVDKEKSEEKKNKVEEKNKVEDKNKVEEKNKIEEKNKVEERNKVEEKNNLEYHAEEVEKVDSVNNDNEREKEIEKEKEKEKTKVVERTRSTRKSKIDEEKPKSEITETRNKKRRKKRDSVSKENSKDEVNKQITLAKIFEAQPPHPPESGLALFTKRYHGRAPVKTAWKNLNKLEKREYKAEVQMLKQKYIKDYELFLKSLSKEQLTAFSQMHKEKNKSNKQERQLKPESSSEDDDDEDDDEDNTDNSET